MAPTAEAPPDQGPGPSLPAKGARPASPIDQGGGKGLPRRETQGRPILHCRDAGLEAHRTFAAARALRALRLARGGGWKNAPSGGEQLQGDGSTQAGREPGPALPQQLHRRPRERLPVARASCLASRAAASRGRKVEWACGQYLSPRAWHLVQGRGNTAIDGEHVVAQGRPISKGQPALAASTPTTSASISRTPRASQRPRSMCMASQDKSPAT